MYFVSNPILFYGTIHCTQSTQQPLQNEGPRPCTMICLFGLSLCHLLFDLMPYFSEYSQASDLTRRLIAVVAEMSLLSEDSSNDYLLILLLLSFPSLLKGKVQYFGGLSSITGFPLNTLLSSSLPRKQLLWQGRVFILLLDAS